MNILWERQEKTVFVTGGTVGIGYERARGLAARGAKENECNDEYSD
jgi:NADP-dependent 3-hydroxy acid dehydrogenase YdfG